MLVRSLLLSSDHSSSNDHGRLAAHNLGDGVSLSVRIFAGVLDHLNVILVRGTGKRNN